MTDSAKTGVLDQLAALGKQNGATIGRILANGNLGMAEDGIGRQDARHDPDQRGRAGLSTPTVLVLPHGGDLELEFFNDDKNTHCAVLPSNGDTQFLWLVNHSRGTASITLDGPGYYWYGSTTGNDEGRGLTGSDRRRGRHTRRGQARPSTPAATVERSRRWQLSRLCRRRARLSTTRL